MYQMVGVTAIFSGANGDYSAANQKYTPWYYAQAGLNVHAGVSVTF